MEETKEQRIAALKQRLIKVSTDRNWNEAFDVFITIKYIKP